MHAFKRTPETIILMWNTSTVVMLHMSNINFVQPAKWRAKNLFGSKCTVLKKVIATLFGLFGASQRFGARGIATLSPLVMPLAMATTAHHNELMIELDEKVKGTIIFLCVMGCYSCAQFSYALMQMFESNDCLQSA